MKTFTLEQLSADIRQRNVGAERTRLVEKWSRTGLLKGLQSRQREDMSQLLENQTTELIREANSLGTGGAGMTSSGQMQGIANIAYPIVRRVFAGLVSGEIVSMQPMSLPSGLIFYIDYTYGSHVGGNAGVQLAPGATSATYDVGDSLYNSPPGRGVQSGSLATGGQYDLVNTGYSRVHSGSGGISGSNASVGAWTGAAEAWTVGGTIATVNDFTGTNARYCNFDMQMETDLQAGTLDLCFVHIPVQALQVRHPFMDTNAVDQVALYGFQAVGGAVVFTKNWQPGVAIYNLRRLNKRGNFAAGVFTPDPLNGDHVQFVVRLANGGAVPTMNTATQSASVALTSRYMAGDSTGAVQTIPTFESDFGVTPSPTIPEINILLQTISITTDTRKLRVRWSPEMAQDINAYHSIDIEVELTQLLSEQVAVEIDREILNDLVTQANGANFYWSRSPGKFVNKVTGAPVLHSSTLAPGPTFTGTIREWYEGLIETIIDVANVIQRKTLRGSANFLVTSPEVSTIIEATTMYRAKLDVDSQGQVASPFVIGAENVGTVGGRFTVYKDPYFPRNKVLVGYKGGSYLETGYVYAPYVPLIMTPTLFAPEDFTPRKGVMTRYGKRMIRSDFYGTTTIMDMNVI